MGDDGNIYVERLHPAYPYVMDFLVSCCEPVSRTHLVEHYRFSSSSLAAASAEGTYSCEAMRLFLRYWQLVGPEREIFLDLEVVKALEKASVERSIPFPLGSSLFSSRSGDNTNSVGKHLGSVSTCSITLGKKYPPSSQDEDEDDDDDDAPASVLELKRVFCRRFPVHPSLRQYPVWSSRKQREKISTTTATTSMGQANSTTNPLPSTSVRSNHNPNNRKRQDWKRKWSVQQRYVMATWWAAAATRFVARYREYVMANDRMDSKGEQDHHGNNNNNHHHHKQEETHKCLTGTAMGSGVGTSASPPPLPLPSSSSTTTTRGGGNTINLSSLWSKTKKTVKNEQEEEEEEKKRFHQSTTTTTTSALGIPPLKIETQEEGEERGQQPRQGLPRESITLSSFSTLTAAMPTTTMTAAHDVDPNNLIPSPPPPPSSSSLCSFSSVERTFQFLLWRIGMAREVGEEEGKQTTHSGFFFPSSSSSSSSSFGPAAPMSEMLPLIHYGLSPRFQERAMEWVIEKCVEARRRRKTSTTTSTATTIIKKEKRGGGDEHVEDDDDGKGEGGIVKHHPVRNHDMDREGDNQHHSANEEEEAEALEMFFLLLLGYPIHGNNNNSSSPLSIDEKEEDEDKSGGDSYSYSSSFIPSLLPSIPDAVEKMIQEEECATKVEIVLQPHTHFSSLRSSSSSSFSTSGASRSSFLRDGGGNVKEANKPHNGVETGATTSPLAYFLLSLDRALLSYLVEGLKDYLAPMYLSGKAVYVLSDIRRGGASSSLDNSKRGRSWLEGEGGSIRDVGDGDGGRGGEEENLPGHAGGGAARVRLLRRLYVSQSIKMPTMMFSASSSSSPFPFTSSLSAVVSWKKKDENEVVTVGSPFHFSSRRSTCSSSTRANPQERNNNDPMDCYYPSPHSRNDRPMIPPPSWNPSSSPSSRFSPLPHPCLSPTPTRTTTASRSSLGAPPLVYKSLIRKGALRHVREALFKQYGIRADCCYDYLHDDDPIYQHRPPQPSSPFSISRLSLRPEVRLRPYQATALDRFCRGKVAHQGVVVLPCGAGKTLTGIAAASILKKRTLVVCVNHMSVFQWQREFLKWTELPPSSVTVCTSKVKDIPGPVFITTYSMLVAQRPASPSSSASSMPTTSHTSVVREGRGGGGGGKRGRGRGRRKSNPLRGDEEDEDEGEEEEEEENKRNRNSTANGAAISTDGGPSSSLSYTATTPNGVAATAAECSEAILQIVQQETWGLLLLDEVHTALAHHFQEVLSKVPHKCVLGLSATLLREDDRISDLRHLVGPKLYEANWLDLSKAGFLAKVECAEIQCFLPLRYWEKYMSILAERETEEEKNNTVGLPSYIFEVRGRDGEGNPNPHCHPNNGRGGGWSGGGGNKVGRPPSSSSSSSSGHQSRSQPPPKRRRRRRFSESSSDTFSRESSNSGGSRSSGSEDSSTEEEKGEVWERRKTVSRDTDQKGAEVSNVSPSSRHHQGSPTSARGSSGGRGRGRRHHHKSSSPSSRRRRGNLTMGPLQNIASCNPVKLWCTQALLHFHLHERSPPDKVLIFCDYLVDAHFYARHLHLPLMEQATSEMEREHILQAFQYSSAVNAIILTRVGDVALDLPNASVVIQVSGLGASRRQEAQRLGRILRPKPPSLDHSCAYFYSLVSQDTHEVRSSYARQSWLRDQGFAYRVIPAEKVLEWFSQRCRQEQEELEEEEEEEEEEREEMSGRVVSASSSPLLSVGKERWRRRRRRGWGRRKIFSTIPRFLCCVGRPQWWYQVTRREYDQWKSHFDPPLHPGSSKHAKRTSSEPEAGGGQRKEERAKITQGPCPSHMEDPAHDRRHFAVAPILEQSSPPLPLPNGEGEQGTLWRPDVDRRPGVFWAPFSSRDSIRLQYYFNAGREAPIRIQDHLPHLKLHRSGSGGGVGGGGGSASSLSLRSSSSSSSVSSSSTISPLLPPHSSSLSIPWTVQFSSVDAPYTFGLVTPDLDEGSVQMMSCQSGDFPAGAAAANYKDSSLDHPNNHHSNGGGGLPTEMFGRGGLTARKITFGTMDPYHYCLDPAHRDCLTFSMETLNAHARSNIAAGGFSSAEG